jgi:putative Mg2+ transporter-C (MgtC) family protein
MFYYEFIIKAAFAALLGALIGLERKTKHFGLGTRTAALISLSSCSFVLAGIAIPSDPTALARIIQGVATGIGFVGGAIIWKQFQDHAMVIGITTAVIVWFLTAIGALVALGLYIESFLITLIALILLLLKRVGVE